MTSLGSVRISVFALLRYIAACFKEGRTGGRDAGGDSS